MRNTQSTAHVVGVINVPLGVTNTGGKLALHLGSTFNDDSDRKTVRVQQVQILWLKEDKYLKVWLNDGGDYMHSHKASLKTKGRRNGTTIKYKKYNEAMFGMNQTCVLPAWTF